MTQTDRTPRQNTQSVGEALVAYLEARDVRVVFGIPGVHTVEMYRGLARSGIHHVTPRHEQGAGFMADGYARASGQPGVAFVITGPGVTNILTPMGQARADSIPMLVVSSVNEARYLHHDLGHLHQMPDQHGLISKMAIRSEHVETSDVLLPALDRLFDDMATQRPGPMHIQVPLDVFGQVFSYDISAPPVARPTPPTAQSISEAAARLSQSKRPLIIAGGGSLAAAQEVQALAEMLDAPVLLTINARGMMYGHPLGVPASPCLDPVADLVSNADVTLAIGTQLGPTDFDVFATGKEPELNGLIRIDLDAEHLQGLQPDCAILGDCVDVMPRLVSEIAPVRAGDKNWGTARAVQTHKAALGSLTPDYAHSVDMVEAIRDTLPLSIIVGDSTQPIYAANLVYAHDRLGGWFNSSVGFGTLGYAIPAAIGAALGAPEADVVCLIGDGGAQFTLPELMTAVDEGLPVIFVIWNNFAFKEIAMSMEAVGVEVVGCHPSPPDFGHIAKACAMPYHLCPNTPDDLRRVLTQIGDRTGPILIEIQTA